MEFNAIEAMGIVGHNNERITGTVPECEAACCARDWCRSFDFVGDTSGTGSCAMADVDMTNDHVRSQPIHKPRPPLVDVLWPLWSLAGALRTPSARLELDVITLVFGVLIRV